MTFSAAAIIPAAGIGTRMKLDHPKQFHRLSGAPILVHTVKAFLKNSHINQIVVVVPADWIRQTREIFAAYIDEGAEITIVPGGQRRQDSVLAGLNAIDREIDIVLVHDGARPLISQTVIDDCYEAAINDGAAIAAVPVKDTLKKGDKAAMVTDTVERNNLWHAQTPQAARRELLVKAFQQLGGEDVTDESSLLQLAGIPVTLVVGSESNIKITRPEDLQLAETIMCSRTNIPIRIGHGYDAHRFAENRKLVLGGVTIPHPLGLAGHSDADVLTHALCDAILGALGEGDIGRHFPDSDKQFSNIYSISLLEHVIALATSHSYSLANCDITLVCQAPRLAPFLDEMKELLAKTCEVNNNSINIKATTTEKMGFTGREEGISCHAVVLLHFYN
ncbi:MAG: bifunctional 2-C-methyl-D-erythritol 4-phosphate cytidylyltransferase/2-C-methyl-D-erythritol 2,4-cyclodiphosphate synthase [Desulfobulbaceae bacterium S3730MH12]|nr:MAG: bifunctional 2-C-methyl-D-erythritol 4-phosphate cytidylyltransferase/2-C-methyl-D-erythritol 2,4-cyclodiphosphate synthase [Desulfobulbaceae bacterium S3730MH12]OEU80275.1 MAG: bifunctional 2-C-methyl-D-erythritol 4-phosphate cytidylyltransferase/2-C-methyl-D-erythritol 2,4-cyclodiphosphate synthase [Desulfobulbaceae bacterium C00003063]